MSVAQFIRADGLQLSEYTARTNDGVTYQKSSQAGLFDSRTGRACRPTRVKKFSDGRYVYKEDAYYKGDIQVGDFVMRDSKTNMILRNISAEERARKGTGER